MSEKSKTKVVFTASVSVIVAEVDLSKVLKGIVSGDHDLDIESHDGTTRLRLESVENTSGSYDFSRYDIDLLAPSARIARRRSPNGRRSSDLLARAEQGSNREAKEDILTEGAEATRSSCDRVLAEIGSLARFAVASGSVNDMKQALEAIAMIASDDFARVSAKSEIQTTMKSNRHESTRADILILEDHRRKSRSPASRNRPDGVLHYESEKS